MGTARARMWSTGGVTLSEATGSPLDLSQSICKIVSAYVSNNHVARSELPALIATVQHTLTSLATGSEVRPEEPAEKPTAAEIRKSITPDALISFIDGKPYKTFEAAYFYTGFRSEQLSITLRPPKRLPNGGAILQRAQVYHLTFLRARKINGSAGTS